MPFRRDRGTDSQKHKVVVRYLESRSNIWIGGNTKLDFACAIWKHRETGEPMQARKIDVAIPLRIENQLVEFRQDFRQMREIPLIGRLIEARKTTGNEYL